MGIIRTKHTTQTGHDFAREHAEFLEDLRARVDERHDVVTTRLAALEAEDAELHRLRDVIA